VAYDPLALFANGESGAWYDPSDLSTLFQDSAGTIPVTEDGQPVGRMLDKSGNDNHATQSVSSKRPTYKSVDGVQWLDFDGIDDILETGNINFSQTDKMSVFCQLQSLINRSSVLVELTNSSQPPGAFSVFVGNGDEGRNYGWSTCSGNGTQAYAASSDLPIPFTLTNTVLIDRSGSSLETLFKPRLNGEPAQIDFPFPHDQNGNFANDNLYIGARGLGGKYLEGKIYGLIVRGVTSTTQEVTDTEKYLTSLTVRDFKPNHLFENNEVGAWYDPSDLSTLFQDPEGTIPVTQDGQPVGLMLDKSKEIELLSELISNGEFTTDTTDWSAHNAVLSIENGTIKVDDSANAGDNSSAQQQLTGLVIGKSYILSGQIVSSNNSGNIVLWQEGENTSVTNNASFILAYVVQEFNGSGVFTATGTTATIGLVSNSVGITYFDNISVKSQLINCATQSVASKRPTYRDVGGVQWLEFDGVDDSMDLGGGFLTPNSVIAFAFEAIGEIALAGDTGGGRFVGIGQDRGNEGFPSTLNVGNPTVLLDGASFTNKTQTELFFAASGNGKHIYSVGGDYTQWSNSSFIGRSNDIQVHHKGAIYGIILYEGETAQKTQDTEEYLTALTVPAGIQQQLSLIAATQYSVTGTTRVERPLNTDIITIVTSQAPDAKPVARSVVVTTFYQDLIRVPNYNVPELVFGGSNTIKSGVGEVMSPLILCNTTNTTAIIDVESYRYLENIKYYFIKNLPIPPYETISIPLNGEFFKTGDMLQIKGDLESGVHAIISFTLGQSEENDV